MSTTSPTPMDPERLSIARHEASRRMATVVVPDGIAVRTFLRELLADRDYHAQRADDAERLADDATVLLAAEVRRLRARVRVEAEDVERAGVTRQHVEAWFRTRPESRRQRHDGSDRVDAWDVPRTTWYLDGLRIDSFIDEQDGAAQTARVARLVASHYSRPGLDILDEMAAMEVPA